MNAEVDQLQSPTSRAALGFFADDLTGASDVLAQAQTYGLSASLVLDPAHLPASSDDVVGIAGPARSLAGEELTSELRRGLKALKLLDFDVVLYKVCSTFDSSPTVGSIGRAVEILHETYPDHGSIPVVPAQPGFGRFTAFSHHFGTYTEEIYRLDRHPVMGQHPVTPMHESDIRMVLADQLASPQPIPGLHLPAFSDGSFLERWRTLRAGAAPAFIVDAVAEQHLDAVASAWTSARATGTSVVIGSGGIVAALARARTGKAPSQPRAQRSEGPTLVISASASQTTADQIAYACSRGWSEVPVPATAFSTNPDDSWKRDAESNLASGRDVIVHSVLGPDDPRLSSGASAANVGATIGNLAGDLVNANLTRDLVICGGDTSSHALTALKVTRLAIRDLFVTAGPILMADEASDVAGCRLLLKGGQVGRASILCDFAGQER